MTSPYMPAANLLKNISTSHKSIKTLAYNKDGELAVSKSVYAQVCHVLECQAILEELLQRVPSLSTVAKNRELLLVLLYELLLGPNKSIRGGGVLKRKLIGKEDELRRALHDIEKEGTSIPTFTAASRPMFPRYVRVNTLKTSLSEAVSKLKASGMDVYVDEHVPHLLVLSPYQSTELFRHELVKDHKIILQDKSSCFSALCLGSSYNGGDLLDACAAPGNKTSHLAALIAEQVITTTNKKATPTKTNAKAVLQIPTVHALDRSSTRFESLKCRMKDLVAVANDDHNRPDDSNRAEHPSIQVVSHQRDFLQLDPEKDFPTVRFILLDPSCSGSGIVNLPDRWSDTSDKDDVQDDKDLDASTNQSLSLSSRLQKLSSFQLKALEHAMSFPKVDAIVYSTCSIHDEENEQVVESALQSNPEWQVANPSCLQNWKRRGRTPNGDDDEANQKQRAACMIRVDPQHDDTNGFFVCLLTRIASHDNVTPTTPSKNNKTQMVPSLPADLEIYQGQFRDAQPLPKAAAVAVAEEMVATATTTTKPQKKTSAKEKDQVASPVKAPKNASTKPDLPKKLAKKLAWKRRQSEQKDRRMKKQKVSKQPEVKVNIS